MKATKTNLILLLSCLLLANACQRLDDYTPQLPLFGFGDLTASLSLTGDTLLVPVYFTRALTEDVTLEFNWEGSAQLGRDFLLPDGPTLFVAAGTDLPMLRIVANTNPDPARLDRFLDLKLAPHPALRLSDRDSMRLTFSLPHTANLSIFAPAEPFPQLWGYTSFGEEPVPPGRGLQAGAHFCFAHKSRTQTNVIGLYNTQEGNSTNALNMHRLYADYDVGTGSANIRILEFVRLSPSEPGSTSGTAEIIPQRVTITRIASSGLPPFTVGISGSGTYNETTGVINLAIYFDETEIGGEPNKLRRYSLEANERN